MKNRITLVTLSIFGLSMLALAQPQDESSPAAEVVQVQTDKPSEGPIDINPNTFDPWLGNVASHFAYVGSSPFQQLTRDIGGFNFGTSLPAAISCQPRQSVNFDFGFRDAFSCQIIRTTPSSIRVRVRRLDQATGWGQNLRLDFIVFSKWN